MAKKMKVQESDNSGQQKQSLLSSLYKEDVVQETTELAFGCVKQSNPARQFAIRVVDSRWFRWLMILIIALNAAFMAIWDPVENLYQVPSVRNDIVQSAELFFQLAYTLELILKLLAWGVYLEGPNTFFRRFWNWFDFVVVILGWAAFAWDLATANGASPLLRAIRVLRPLRGLQYVYGLRVLNNTVVRSLEQLGDVALFLLITYFFFAVVGLTIFQGKLHQKCGWQPSDQGPWRLYGPTSDRFCSLSPGSGFQCPNVTVIDSDTGEPRPVLCAAEFPTPNAGLTGFDNIFQAMLTIFVMVTLEGWTDVMYWYSDSTSAWSAIYFIALIMFGGFIVLSLITALLTVNYTAERQSHQVSQAAAAKQQRIAELKKSAEQRHKALEKAREAFLSDIELRLIYSYEKYGQTPGYNIVSRKMYEKYITRHSRQEIIDFAAKVAKAMVRRRKLLNPGGETHLFESTPGNAASSLIRGSRIAGSEDAPSISSVVDEDSERVDEVPEYISNEVVDDKPPPPKKNRKYLYEEQYGVPLGEKPDRSCLIYVCYAIVMNPYFRGFIWFCIVANTVLLGYDHFLQPPFSVFLSNILSNILTGIYTAEALLKITGFGPNYYFADRFNIFDFFVVSVSWVEIIVALSVSGASSAAASSAFRIVRLLRVFRLAQYWASLKTLLSTIIRTFRGVYPFTVMLVVFLYVFTVSGLLIFGGLMTISPLMMDPVTLEEIPNPEFDCTRLAGHFYFGNVTHCPTRTNYDTFLWSFVTSFQLLTRENWNEVMYDAADAVDSWVPALYFVSVIVLGSFIVLNLFLAILIDSFMETHDQERIVHRENLERRRKLREERLRRRKDRQYRKRVLGTELMDSSNSQASSRHGGNLNRQDSATSLGAPVEGSQSGQESDGGLRSWVKTRLFTIESETKSNRLLSHPAFKHHSLFVFSPSNAFRVFCAWLSNTASFQIFIVLIIVLSCILLIVDVPSAGLGPATQNTFYILNSICIGIFVLEMVLKIVGFGFVTKPGSYLRDPWNIMDLIVVVLSIADLAVANQPGLSVFKAARAFRPLKIIRHVEGMRIAVGSLIHAIGPVSQIAVVALMFYFIFAVIATALFGGRMNNCYICDHESCTVPLVNATLGLPMLGRSCFPYRTYGVSDCPPPRQCVGGFVATDSVANKIGVTSWRNPSYDLAGSEYSFDNVLVSMLLLYEVSTLELWPLTMSSTTDIVGIGHAPIRGASDINSLFFVAFVFFTNFFLLQLFVASVVDSFSETDMKYSGKAFMSESQFEWVEMQHKVNRMTFARDTKPPSGLIRRKIYNFVEAEGGSDPFESFILVIIVLNSVLLASEHYHMDPIYFDFLNIIDYVFGGIYMCEGVLRFIAIGWKYFQKYLFDFLILVSIILTWIFANTDVGGFFEIFEVFRLFRIWRLVRRHQGISNLVTTLVFSIPALLNILLLVFLLFFVYTAVGIQLFGSIPSSELQASQMGFVGDYVNFHNFGTAIVTLFRMATGESWNGIMRDLATESPLAWPYCITFILFIQLIFLNLFVAIVLGNFNAVLTKSKKDVISSKSLVDFNKAWQISVNKFEEKLKSRLLRSAAYDKTGESTRKPSKPDERVARLALLVMDSTYLPATMFPDFFVCLQPPLGLSLSKSLSPSDMMRFIRIANIPVTKTGMISARATLSALIDQALGTERNDESYELMKSALRIRMFFDSKSKAAHHQSEAETAQTHSVAEEIATRRLQITARYLLARKRLEQEIMDGVSTAEEGAQKLEQLSIKYFASISSLVKLEAFGS